MLCRFALCKLILAAFTCGTLHADSWQVDAMDGKAKWAITGHRLHYTLGSSKLDASREPARPGAASVLKLTCDLAERSWIGIQWRGGPLPGKPERLSFWLHGDKCGQALVARMEDAAGRVYQVPLGPIDFDGWRQIDVPMDASRWTPVRRQGDTELPVRWPVCLREIRVVKATAKCPTPTVALSDLRAAGQPGPIDKVQIDLACEAPAHLFYDGEPVQLQARLTNLGDVSVSGRLEAVVGDWLGNEQRYALGRVRIEPRKEHQQTCTIPLTRLGSYTVWLQLAGDSGMAVARQRIALGRRREATPLDPNSPMGMGLYLPRFADVGQLDLAFNLAREAGVKWTRGDLSIAHCQPEPGRWVWDVVQWEAGRQGHAVALSPHIRYKVASSESLNRPCASGELTMSLRVQLKALDYEEPWRTLVSKGDGGARQWYLFWNVKTHQMGLSLGDGKARWADCLAQKRDWEVNRWYDFVVAHRRADRTVRWWVDGQPAGAIKVPFADTLAATDTPMTIGGGLQCSLDDLVIYDRCLAPEELKTVKPVASWSFDEGKGLDIADRTGGNSIHAEPWRYDAIFARTRAEGISTYCVVTGTPRWMTAKPSAGQERPGLMMPRLDDWSAAFEKLVLRQKLSGIRTWEIWNEPNIKSFWSPEPNAEEYAQVLIASYKAIKRADPQATVLGCGLAGPNGPRYRLPYEFVEAVLKLGGGQAMDAISIHPYRQPRTPEDSGYLDDIQAISDLTAKYGRRLPIWITEIGWPTDPSGSSESRSAQLLVRSYLLALSHGVQNIAWYDYHDDGTDPSYNEHHFGVLYHDMTPKPSYFAFRTMATELAGLKFERQVSAGEGVSVLVFGDGQRHACVAWSHQGAKQLAFQLPDRKRMEVVDLMGNAQAIDVGDGAWLATIDESPVFLRDVPASLAVVRPIETAPAVLKALPGESRTLQVTLRNPYSRPWRLSWAGENVELMPGDMKAMPVTRTVESWLTDLQKPWQANNGAMLSMPARAVVLDGRREPILRHEAEINKPIELPDTAGATATDEVTIAARFRSDGSTGTWQSLATKWEGERRNWGVFLTRDKGELAFSASFTKGPGSFSDVSSEHSLFDGRWHRIAVTYSAHDAEICFYVDGQLVRQVPRDGGKLLTNQCPVRMAGGFTDGKTKPAQPRAAVSQLQVWNRALTADEIRRLGAP